MAVNSRGEIAGREARGRLTWSGPALMLFARPILSLLAQGLVAGGYALQSAATPWVAAARWLPVYGHAFQPLRFDPDFMLYRFLAPIPYSVFQTALYLHSRRLLPFVIAHWLMDGGDVFATLLLPHLH